MVILQLYDYPPILPVWGTEKNVASDDWWKSRPQNACSTCRLRHVVHHAVLKRGHVLRRGGERLLDPRALAEDQKECIRSTAHSPYILNGIAHFKDRHRNLDPIGLTISPTSFSSVQHRSFCWGVLCSASSIILKARLYTTQDLRT